jgi:O-antigen/teichoic acid export membrane protein
MRSLSSKAALLITANALKYFVGFALPMVLVRLLSKQDYGTYQQLSLVASIATGIMVLGLPTSVYYFYHHVAKTPAGRPTLIAQTQLMLLLCGLVATIAIIIGAPVLARRMNNPALAALLPTYACYVGLFLAGEQFMHVMISQNRYRLAVGLEAAETIFRVALLVCLLSLGRGLYDLVVALVVYAGLRLAVRSFWIARGADSVRHADWRRMFPLEQLAYGIPLAATTCIGLVGGLLDRAIVAVAFTPVAYAIYSVGALEIPLDSIFQSSVSNVLRASLPSLIAQGQTEEIVRIWRQAVRKLAIVVIPTFIFLLFFSRPFIVTFFTEHYAASVNVFRIYLWLIPLHMFVLSTIPQVYGRTRLNLYVAAIAVSMNAVLSLILLRTLGILGPALSMVVSQYVASTLFFLVTKKLLKAKARHLLPLPEMARTTAASLLSLLPALGLWSLLGTSVVSFLCSAVVFGLAGLICGFYLSIFSAHDIKLARSWASRVIPMRRPT